jgi:hypothetical protein
MCEYFWVILLKVLIIFVGILQVALDHFYWQSGECFFIVDKKFEGHFWW